MIFIDSKKKIQRKLCYYTLYVSFVYIIMFNEIKSLIDKFRNLKPNEFVILLKCSLLKENVALNRNVIISNEDGKESI